VVSDVCVWYPTYAPRHVVHSCCHTLPPSPHCPGLRRWVFSQLWSKGLVYRSFKVMPYSTACNTPLSNFEAGLNYKEDTTDPAVVVRVHYWEGGGLGSAVCTTLRAPHRAWQVSFPLVDDPKTAFVAWTTTPWTLPSNLGLCVNPELVYARVRDVKSGNTYILAESRLVQLYPRLAKKE